MATSSSIFEFMVLTHRPGNVRTMGEAVDNLNGYVSHMESDGYILKHWQVLPEGFILMEFAKADSSFTTGIGTVELWDGGEVN